jgi:hypothetical protein
VLARDARASLALRRAFGELLQFLMVLVGLVLLTTCAKAANHLLSSSTARQKVFAKRLAIDAGRGGRLILQFLTESLLRRLTFILGIRPPPRLTSGSTWLSVWLLM